MILPVSTTTPQTSPSVKINETKDTLKKYENPVESYSTNMDDSDVCPASIPIEPIVFSFDNEGMTFISKKFKAFLLYLTFFFFKPFLILQKLAKV